MVVMKMNKKYTDNLSESSSEIETACSPSRAHFSISLRKYLPFSVFFFYSPLQLSRFFFQKNLPPPKMKTSPALLYLLSVSCLEKVPSQPPPWRGGSVLGHASMHAACLKKSAFYSSQMLPTLQNGKKKVVKNAQNLDQNEGAQIQIFNNGYN